MPPHHAYVEPFLGSGAVMRMKRLASTSVGIDKDAGVIASFRAEDRAVIQSQVSLIVTDALRWLPSSPLTRLQDTLMYCDPPYLMSSRNRSRNIYEEEMGTADEHHDLLVSLRCAQCMVMVSGYDSPLYREMLATWRLETFMTMTRGGRMAKECVWFNFPPAQRLHDYRYLGRNFRERLRIKRKISRWRGKLQRMPELERMAMLAALDGDITAPEMALTAASA